VASEGVEVEVFRRLADLAPWRGALADLNLASGRPSPFQTLEYLEAYQAHDEQAQAGAEPLVLVAFAGGRPIGLLPLRLRPARALGLRCARLEHFTVHDADRPGLVARAEDEARCAEAFLRHLTGREPGWDLLELAEQDASSPLASAAAVLPDGRFYVRRFPNNPNGTVELRRGFEPWFRGLHREQRSKMTRRARALLGPGDVELLVTRSRAAAAALLDLYLDVEGRSWKAAARAGIARHPERVAFFRSLLAPGQPAEPTFLFLLRAGLPIAGFLTLAFERTVYGLEMAFDEAEGEAAPGNVLMLLAIREAAARGATGFNMLGNYEYHKARWKAAVTETAAIQVFRRFGPHHLRAVVGEWRRRVVGSGTTQRDVEFNLTRHRAAGRPREDLREAARSAAEARLARLAAEGHALERCRGAALAALLPFAIPGLTPPAAAPPPRRRGQRQRAAGPAGSGS